MTFLFPLGLLGLLGIPVIILIYILQSKYTEQTVPSTYLWTLSEKFLKRKNPLSGLTGWISLLLQILTVAILSLIIAHPVITLPDAAHDYCFILDASGSMTMEENGERRFDMAKDEIADVVRHASEGSTYTLYSVSDTTVKTFHALRDKETALRLLEGAVPAQVALSHADLLKAAQTVFDENRSARIYLITDKDYQTHENLEWISVGSPDVENYAVFDVTYSHSGARLEVSANAVSYLSDKKLELCLSVNGEAVDTQILSVRAGEHTPITLSASVSTFDSFTVEVLNADGYAADNRITTYNLKSDKTYSTLIVSEKSFFFEAVIDALTDAEVVTVTPDEYAQVKETYGLYIFDSYAPPALPDGSVWLINVDESIDGAGFGVRGRNELREAATLERSSSTATAVRTLLDGVEGESIYISGSYIKYSGMYLNHATLFSYDSNPLIFAGANARGQRQVVFGFDLHQSDLALSTDFVTLAGNLLDYSFPNVIDETSFTVGEEAVINLVANSSNLTAKAPSGRDLYMETNGTVATLSLDEVGTYVISLSIAGRDVSYRIYAGAHPDESLPSLPGEDFSLSGEAEHAKTDGTYDPTLLLFIILTVLFIADWGVYCYEKYQLR